MEYCPHCMRPAEGAFCSHCGGGMHDENQSGLLPVGTVLSQNGRRWQLGAALGSGGFGVTYIGLDLESGQRVAVKEFFPTRCARRGKNGQVEPMAGQEATYDGGKYQFVKEARMLASLEGMPSVVQGLAYLERNNTAYLVMEYLDGTPLYRMVDEENRVGIPAGDLLPRLKPLMLDIGKLHAKGVVHRDISPDNVMWMRDGTLKLLDFGSARFLENGKSATVLIKHGFAPAEQYGTHGQGPWTDVYALSATVYYCLTGRKPVPAPDRLTRLSEGEADPLVPPAALGAALTPEEENALLWGLSTFSKDRPRNMEELAESLYPVEIPVVPVREDPPVRERESFWARLRRWLGL